jgi:hypothetical protein
MKWQRLSNTIRVAFGFFCVLSAFATWSIAMGYKSSDDLVFLVTALLFTAAFGFGAIAGRFPDAQKHREVGRSDDAK